MFDTREEILDQLRAGEDARAEFKELQLRDSSVVSPRTEEMAGELVAFANADGGAVFVGVRDDGVVQGIPEDRSGAVERWIVAVANGNCEPPIRPVIRRDVLPRPDGTDALVFVVTVRRGLAPYRTSGGRYYVRVGSTKQDLRSHELGRLFQDRGRAFVFDEQPVPDARREDLDEAQIQTWVGAPAEIPEPDLLRNTRITVADESGVDRPTVAGLLAFGREPNAFLRSAIIEAAVYRSDLQTSNDLVHSMQIAGTVGTQIDEATAFVERFMLMPATKAAGREDFPQYDIASVHEAIVNAVVHRNYAIDGAKVRLFLFNDRLELSSPGGLPNTLTVETMAFRVFTRNQLLVRFLSQMRSRRTGRAFLESRGEGVRQILQTGERLSGRRPEYQLFGDELRLTIWARPSPHDG